MNSFGDRIRIARKRAKITQSTLADKVEAHRASVVRWEKGDDLPSFPTGCRLARALGVNALWLAGMTDNPRQGVQFTEEEFENFKRYEAMDEDGKRALRAYVRDFHDAHVAARKMRA